MSLFRKTFEKILEFIFGFSHVKMTKFSIFFGKKFKIFNIKKLKLKKKKKQKQKPLALLVLGLGTCSAIYS
jgi:uncharacterized OsmC-like protein